MVCDAWFSSFIVIDIFINNVLYIVIFLSSLFPHSLAMFYVIALAGAHKRVINQLREQLVLVGLCNTLTPCIEWVLLREFNICGIVVHQEGRDKRFLIQKLCQAQKISIVRSPVSNPRSSSSSSYHTSFSNNFNESVFLAHPPPDSATHVWDTAAHPRTRQICKGRKLNELLSPTYFLFCIFFLFDRDNLGCSVDPLLLLHMRDSCALLMELVVYPLT